MARVYGAFAKAKVKIPPASEADIALMAKAREAYAEQTNL